MSLSTCPACGSQQIRSFYRHTAAPVHSVLVHHSQADALALRCGEIQLGFCQNCGFIFNQTFDPTLQDYSLEYESTQGFSPTFGTFARQLAQYLVDRYDLHGKRVIEIGCGQGEFLQLLCAMGDNHGIGFDPAYMPGRISNLSPELTAPESPQFVRDYYSEKYSQYQADLIVCKMTLEHIQPVAEFVSTVRRSIGDHLLTAAFFQIPDARRILQEAAFWDVYYEHCSYFSLGSLARLFRKCGFEVMSLRRGYDDQYLMIEARPTENAQLQGPLPEEDDLAETEALVEQFALFAPERITAWQGALRRWQTQRKRVMLWGGGSKAVAFLTTLGVREEVIGALDINPYKDGSFLAATGTPVYAPQHLPTLQPDIILLMNPIYQQEVSEQLAQFGLKPTLLAITNAPEER